MNNPSLPPMDVDRPPLVARALVRTAKSGIYLVRGVPPELQSTARARAVREMTSLSAVLRQALREYAAGTWTPGFAITNPST